MTTTNTIKRATNIEAGAMQKMIVFGASGRISDIIGKHGYNKLVDALEAGDTDKLETLQAFTGWALEYLQEEGE